MTEDQESQFKFDPEKSEESNLTAFFQYLKTDDAELTDILEVAVDKMSPLPDGSRRASLRTQANMEIEKCLDQVEEEE